jgi:dTDP-4-dehydrorhamnose reductase
MLGSQVLDFFVNEEVFDIYTFGRNRTNKVSYNNQYFTVDSQFEVKKKLPKVDCIIHCAANTNLSDCESNIRDAIKVNVQMVELLNQFATAHTKLYYISTDSVFDGLKGNYLETDNTRPLNNYAKTKLKGEFRAKKKFIGKSTVVRTNIYGFNFPLKNTLVEWALKEWELNKEINGFDNLYFNAIYTRNLAQILYKLVITNCQLDYLNIASKDRVSKYEFLDILREEFNYNKELLRNEIYIQENQKIKRPMDTTLNVDLISTLCVIPTLREGILNLRKDWINCYENR